MSELVKRRCKPCEGGAKPMSPEKAREMLAEVPGWSLAEDAKSISRESILKDFVGALEFVNQVGDLAEFDDHHPDIHISYNRVRLELSTHAIKGLSENDFILAAKINTLPV